ncbi:MAG: branched-chain amino acid transporter permease [Suipraeoptans sp.]
MSVDAVTSIIIILLVAGTTFTTRVLPFVVFPKDKPIPKTVIYLGKVLTPAIIGMLVVYCLRSTNFMMAPFGLPEVISVLVTATLHIWKRNNLLSIGSGTILYMVLIQTNILSSLLG